MVTVDYDITVKRSPAEVFDYVTDVERLPDWQSEAGLKRVTKAEPGPLKVGSRFTMERESRGRIATIECDVTRLESGRRFDFHSIDSDGIVGDFTTTLTPVPSGTNLHWSVRMTPPNLVYRLLQPLMAREIRRSADADFANLRRVLEGG